MGIDLASARFLSLLGRAGVDFSQTATLGRQNLFAKPFQLSQALRDTGREVDGSMAAELLKTGYSEPFFEFLGAKRVDSIDATAYEQATLVHDLNRPIPADLHASYSAVFDGGTLEHVFNFPTAVENAMRLVRPHGHFITITTANNYCGHGFYQFSPELMYRVLSPANGFEIEGLFLHEISGRLDAATIWQIVDPATLGRRINIRNSVPTLMMVVARRTSDTNPLRDFPQQSDYVQTWQADSTKSVRIDTGLRARTRAMRTALRRPLNSFADLRDLLRATRDLGKSEPTARRLKLDSSFIREWKSGP